MIYVYKCGCGFAISFTSKKKPPKNIECKQCKAKMKKKKQSKIG